MEKQPTKKPKRNPITSLMTFMDGQLDYPSLATLPKSGRINLALYLAAAKHSAY
jgi:hypothetical protein